MPASSPDPRDGVVAVVGSDERAPAGAVGIGIAHLENILGNERAIEAVLTIEFLWKRVRMPSEEES
jgi:hypothetical protein